MFMEPVRPMAAELCDETRFCVLQREERSKVVRWHWSFCVGLTLILCGCGGSVDSTDPSGGGTGPEDVVAGYSVSPTSGGVPLQVLLTDTSSGNPTSWEWDIGDNGSVDSVVSGLIIPVYQPGTSQLIVRLTVTGEGGSDSIVHTTQINTTNNAWYVAPGGDDADYGTTWIRAFATIQHAIDTAQSGNVIWLDDGTFAGTGNYDLDFGGKNLRMWSRNGVNHTYVDAGSYGRAFHFHSGETNQSVVGNITIRYGAATQGAGVLIEGASPSLQGCLILGNVATGQGGGVCVLSGAPEIRDCVFFGNSSAVAGGGLALLGGTGIDVRHCVFYLQNTAPMGAGVFVSGAQVSVENVLFQDNEASSGGGAIACVSSSVVSLSNCTLRNNDATDGFFGGVGGGLYVSSSQVDVGNSILWGNTADGSGFQIFTADTGALVDYAYSAVSVGAGDVAGSGTATGGAGNITLAPTFASASDPHLLAGSEGIDVGDNADVPATVQIDLDGNVRIQDGDGSGTATVDMGVFELSP